MVAARNAEMVHPKRWKRVFPESVAPLPAHADRREKDLFIYWVFFLQKAQKTSTKTEFTKNESVQNIRFYKNISLNDSKLKRK